MQNSRRKNYLKTFARIVTASAVPVALAASVASAHDFWIIPELFAFSADATVHVNGRQGGGRFPAGAAVQPDRVVDARIIGAATSTRITEMSVEGTSLKLHQKPSASGQYLVVVGLTPRVMRQAPTGVIRFLRLEGGVAEAARLERENTFAGLDTVIFTSATYASTTVQVGSGGPRAFSKTAGIRLEFSPLNDPANVGVGDTLHVRILGNGKPVPGIGIELVTAIDSAAPAAQTVERIAFSADANGVVHLPLTTAGPVMLRSAYASRKQGGATNEWDVSRSTYVFNVHAKK